MKIYTKTGDQGETSLAYGKRVKKTDPRVEAYGTCDEANSLIGLAISFLGQDGKWGELKKSLHIVQTKLFHIGSELATPSGKKAAWPILEEDVEYLERQIDRLDAELKPLSNFILPGGHPASSALHAARAVVRRAERRTVAIPEPINPVILKFLNRLSDFLFVAARWVNHQCKIPDQILHQDEISG